MNGTSGVRTTDFVDVVLADQDWLAAEFAAIIAAEFGGATERRPRFAARGPSEGPDRFAGRQGSPVVRPTRRVDPRRRSPPPYRSTVAVRAVCVSRR